MQFLRFGRSQYFGPRVGLRNQPTTSRGSGILPSPPRNVALSAASRGFSSIRQSLSWAADCLPTRFVGQLPATICTNRSTFEPTLVELEVALAVLLVHQWVLLAYLSLPR